MTVGTKAAVTPSFKFVGNFPRSLDAKGRVILPSRMRAHFQEHGYLTPGADGCLALWPEEEFEAPRHATTCATGHRW
jgi:DNA-binding transcriptional regulator/RsmH inhibitor MraZ